MEKREHEFLESYKIDEKYCVLECKTCGFNHVYPYPDSDFLENFYSMEYKDELSKINIKEKALRLKNLPGKKEILDIGCGRGQLLEIFRDNGFETYGIEPSRAAVKECTAKGMNVIEGFLDTNVFGRKFDFVNISFVLEHIPEPQNFIAKIKREFLSEDGYLSIEVPNDFNLLQMVYMEYHKEAPYWIHFPDHLNYWNFDTFGVFLENLGFDIIYRTSSFPLEMFLLMDEDYIRCKELGKAAHTKRLNFESKFKEAGRTDYIFKIYEKLAEINMGREIQVIAKLIKGKSDILG